MNSNCDIKMEESPLNTSKSSLSLIDNTSPSQLQEITFDPDDTTFSNTVAGILSPSGGALRGRSVKEIEEQLSKLKTENFNLKLRIYFLEEKMGVNFTLDKDNIVKKNIEYQMEIANLRKEVQEKHQLLCQAVKAMEIEEEEHKKYASKKEDQLNMCQQELDDLRLQLQDTKFESDGISVKSDTTGFYSSRATNSGNNVTDLQERIKILEAELHMERENNAGLQFAISQTETWKNRYENMQKEIVAKDEIIKNITEELEIANKQMSNIAVQMKDLQEKLEMSYKENQTLQKTLQADSKKMDEVTNQMLELRKKYSMTKADLEREQKKSDRVKIMNDMKVTELEEEREKQKIKIRDLQNKLETAMMEIRKNQNLAVPKSPKKTSTITHTDANSISVQNSATFARVAEKDALYVPMRKSDSNPEKYPNSSSQSSSLHLSKSSSLSSPGKFNVKEIEELLNASGDKTAKDKILSDVQNLSKENHMLNQKIIKLKSEQMKACEIIKNMIDSRNKANDEITQLKEHIKELEHELESVVTKQTSDGDHAVSLRQKVVESKISAVAGGSGGDGGGSNNDVEKSPSPPSMAESRQQDPTPPGNDEIIQRYKTLTIELEAQAEVLVAILNEKDYQMQNLRQQYDEILTTLEEKENKIVDLEFELMTAFENGKHVDQSLLEKSDRDSEKHSSFYRHEIEEKDKEIEKLTVELKKCTCYLQEIVNKELWSKNKEIEKLQNKQANSPELIKLKKDLSSKDHQLNILKEKISELGLAINIPEDIPIEPQDVTSSSVNFNYIKNLQDQLEQCKAERNYFKEKLKEYESMKFNDIIEDLRLKNEILKEELEKSENMRRNSNEICSHLSTRLEELAVFLDSLLKQKSILGFLGIHKERKIREIVNNSLDLSKSFAMSMIIHPDQSLTQLSNITSLLNGSSFQDLTLDRPQEKEEHDDQAVLSIVPANITLTYQSHLHRVDKNAQPNSEQVINALREQIFTLKSELQLRDIELNKLNTLKETTDGATETDSLNVNDMSRDVKAVSKLLIPSISADCQSESEAWSEPDINVSRERIGLSQTSSFIKPEAESTENDSVNNSTTPTRRTFEKRASFTELHHQISQLQDEVKIKTESLRSTEENMLKLKDIEEQLKETQAKLANTERKAEDLENESRNLKKIVEELEKTKDQLQEQMVVKDKEMKTKINLLELENNKSREIAEAFEIEAREAKKTVNDLEEKVKHLNEANIKLEETIRRECDELNMVKIKNLEEQFMNKLKEIETKAEANFKDFKDEYSRDYVRKNDIEEKLKQLDKLQKEIVAFKSVVKSYEETIDSYLEKEKDHQHKQYDYQEKISVIRKELDNVTLQYSEAVLEKTKLTNEKTILEQEVAKFRLGGTHLKRQVEDIKSDFEKANVDCQKQIKNLQRYKSDLEMKISELESMNAELYNKLVKSQTNQCDVDLSFLTSGHRNVPTVQILPYKRQLSGQTSTSEDILDDCSDHIALHPNARSGAGDIERREANSSPDLGIESDQGRFSSLEIPNQRPMLPTLELTESMNNLLDGDASDPLESVACENEHCCQKNMEIVRENTHLKRKVQKLGRALQDSIKQLNIANQRKKEVEKTICKQIHKTSQVLRQAKANLDSGSDNDLFKS